MGLGCWSSRPLGPLRVFAACVSINFFYNVLCLRLYPTTGIKKLTEQMDIDDVCINFCC